MSDPLQGATRLSRHELYEKVWTVSMRKLAAEYGLSDVGLAKTCDRHEIPKPPVGYWAKLEVGKAPPRPPLQPASDPSLEQITLWRSVSHKPSSPSQAPPNDPADPEISRAFARVQALAIQPPDPEAKLHAAAEKTIRALERSTKSKYPGDRQGLFSLHWGRAPEPFEIYTSAAGIPRIGRLVDMLMRACGEMEMKIKTIEDHGRSSPHLEFLGEHFRFYIREKVKQRPHVAKDGDRYSWQKYDYDPQGILELRLLHRGRHGRERSWIDRQKAKIEENLIEVFSAMVMAVDESRKSHAAKKKEMEEQREAERVAEEKRHTRQQDLDSAWNLLDQTERWHIAEAIRRYAEAVRAQVEVEGPIEPESHNAKWLAWAARTADRLDPMHASKEDRLTLDALYPPSESRWGGYQQVESVHRVRPTWLGGWPNRNR